MSSANRDGPTPSFLRHCEFTLSTRARPPERVEHLLIYAGNEPTFPPMVRTEFGPARVR